MPHSLAPLKSYIDPLYMLHVPYKMLYIYTVYILVIIIISNILQ